MHQFRRPSIAAALATLVLSGCSTAAQDKALSSPAGALFCSLQLSGGTALVVAVANAAAAQAAGPSAAFVLPIAVLAEGQTKAYVDSACQRAAAVLAAKAGTPVPPPAVPVPTVPIVPPTA